MFDIRIHIKPNKQTCELIWSLDTDDEDRLIKEQIIY